MKKTFFLIAALLCVSVLNAKDDKTVEYKYTDATKLTVVGKVFNDTPQPFHRLDTEKYQGFAYVAAYQEDSQIHKRALYGGDHSQNDSGGHVFFPVVLREPIQEGHGEVDNKLSYRRPHIGGEEYALRNCSFLARGCREGRI